jgi:hypothetical protein
MAHVWNQEATRDKDEYILTRMVCVGNQQVAHHSVTKKGVWHTNLYAKFSRQSNACMYHYQESWKHTTSMWEQCISL